MTPAMVGNPGSHYVTFIVNLKDQKFEFLNSLNEEGLFSKSGDPTAYKKMFDIWLQEVEAYVTDLYRLKNIAMPFEFSKFKWESPNMPIQPDKNSCGVFCMKFLDEWAGDSTTLQSFKGWSILPRRGKNGKEAKVMDLRIAICCTLLLDSSNANKDRVKKNAISYYKKKIQVVA